MSSFDLQGLEEDILGVKGEHEDVIFFFFLPTTTDFQYTLPVNSRETKEIEHAVKRQTWDSNDLVRDISNVQIKKVDNRWLERGYHEKRSELREKGRTPKELTEQLAFTVETDEYRVKAICRDGLKCTGINHTLGDGRMGVTVWRCPDLCLRGLNWPASGSAFLLVFKVSLLTLKNALLISSLMTEKT